MEGRKLTRRPTRHGAVGHGGVTNPDDVNGEIPALDRLAERMFLDDQEDAETFAAAIAAHGDPSEAEEPPDLPPRLLPRILARYVAVRDVIRNGNQAGKKDPEGPSPLNMPAWAKSIPDEDVEAVIADLITAYDFDE